MEISVTSAPRLTAASNKQHLLKLYRQMLLIRQSEEQLARSHQRGLIHGACHTYVGQEAIAVGVCANLRGDDVVFSTHRGHGHALAKGVPPQELFAELFGRQTGCSRGRGGSMHLFAPEVGLMGTTGIVGPCILQAAGAGYSFRLLKTDRVAVAFFGDGAVNNGAFHEGLNLAGIWKLPVLFVCENNQYATEVPFAYAAGNPRVAPRAAAYGLPGVEVDGNDVLAVQAASAEAVRRARQGEGPTLLECKTYRTRPHAEGMGDFSYRTRAEVADWKTRCPLASFRLLLLEDLLAEEADLAEIEAEVQKTVEAAQHFAEQSPFPDPSTATAHVYSAASRTPVAHSRTPVAHAPGSPARETPVAHASGSPARETPVAHASGSPARETPVAHASGSPARETPVAHASGSPAREITFMQATLEGLTEAMAKDPTIFVLGEGIGKRGGNFNTTTGLYDRFGPERLRDTPICERGFVGLCTGAAMTGTRPVVDFMFVDFVLDAMGEFINQIAKMQYMSSGRLTVPLLLRGCIGINGSAATHHSGSYYSIFAHIPGLRVVVPSNPHDAKGLLKRALHSHDPVVFLEHRALLGLKGPVPAEEYAIEFGQAAVVRAGTDVTVVALSIAVQHTLKACAALEQEGVSVELIDPRTVAPLDVATIVQSVRKTGRLLIVDEAFAPCGIGAEIAAQVADQGFDDLDAPIRRLNGAHTPTPYSPPLEKAVVPNPDTIAQAIRDFVAE